MSVASKPYMNKLFEFDWSFSKYSSANHISDLHPYPARFIPIIPRTIIQHVCPKPGMKILDPFAGCGTTLIEGLEQGHHVVGVDVNGLATLLQRAYTYSYTDRELADFNAFSLELIDYVRRSFSKGCVRNVIEIPNVDHWFSSDAVNLLNLTMDTLLKNSTSEPIKDLARLAISRIVVRISRQKSDTQYAAVEKKSDTKTMLKILFDSFGVVHQRFLEANRNFKAKSVILYGDSRLGETYKDVQDVDLVITSPPYPNAFEYWLYHKYRMYWLGLDPLWSRGNEIGARPFYSGTGKLGPWDFQNDIRLVLEQLHKITTKNAVQFWVVGDSIIKGQLVDNAKLIAEACGKTGWKVIDKLARDVKRSRSSFQGIGRQKREDILVIAKQ